MMTRDRLSHVIMVAQCLLGHGGPRRTCTVYPSIENASHTMRRTCLHTSPFTVKDNNQLQ